MNTRDKTISELEKKRSALKETLSSHEARLGRLLLTTPHLSIADKTVQRYTDFDTQKEQNLQMITSIQKLVAKRDELKRQTTAIKSKMTELNAQWAERLENLGNALYEQYDDYISPAFSTWYDQIVAQEKLAEAGEEKVAQLEDDILSQGFFTKIVTQVKLSSLKNTVASYRRKIKRIKTDGAKAVVDGGTLDEAYQANNLPSAATHTYERCLSLKEEISSQKDLIDSLSFEDNSAKDALMSLGVSDTGEKRIELLRQENRQKDTEQTALCQKTGHEFANLYVTPDGEDLMEYSGLGDDVLPLIKAGRGEFLSLNRRIEILQISAAVEQTEKKIFSLQKNIEDNSRKIEKLQKDTQELEEKMNKAEEAKETLLARRTILEGEEGTTVKLLADS